MRKFAYKNYTQLFEFDFKNLEQWWVKAEFIGRKVEWLKSRNIFDIFLD